MGRPIELSRLRDGRYLSYQVRQLARELVDRLEVVRPGTVERLRADTFGEVRSWTDLRVEVSPTSAIAGCSVAGHFNPVTKVITVMTASPGRQSFTLLHEVGHYLQQQDDSWVDNILAVEPDLGRRLEEQVCEAIAAEVLLGDEEIYRVLGDQIRAARDIRELFRETQASRAACCVAAAHRLGRTGWILLTDWIGNVHFGVGSGDRTPPQRGVNQGSGHISIRAADSGSARGDSEWVVWRSGRRWAGLNGDAVSDDTGQYVFVVLTRIFRPAVGEDRNPACWAAGV